MRAREHRQVDAGTDAEPLQGAPEQPPALDAWDPATVLRLQHSAGNAAVARVLQRTPVGTRPVPASGREVDDQAQDVEAQDVGADARARESDDDAEETAGADGESTDGAAPATVGADVRMPDDLAAAEEDLGDAPVPADASGADQATAGVVAEAEQSADDAAEVAPEAEAGGEADSEAGTDAIVQSGPARPLSRSPRSGAPLATAARRARPTRGSARGRGAIQRNFLGDLWQGAKKLVHKGKEWVEDHIVDPIKDLATGAWSSITGIGSQVGQAWSSGEAGILGMVGGATTALAGARDVQQSMFASATQKVQRDRATTPPVASASPLKLDPEAKETLKETGDFAKKNLVGVGGATPIGQELLEGALLGDAIKRPSGWNTLGQTAIGFVPILGQIADARDTVLAIKRLHESGWKDGWGNLMLVLLAWVPGVGDVLKGGGKLLARLVGQNLSGLAKRARTMWKGVARLIPGLTKGAREWGRKIAGAARRLSNDVVNRVRQTADSARQKAKEAYQRAGRFIGEMGTWVKSRWNDATSWARNAADGVSGVLGRVVGAVTSAVNSIVSKAKSWIGGAVDFVKRTIDAGKNVARKLGTKVRNAAKSAVKFAKWAVGTAKQKAKQLWESTKRIAAEKWTAAQRKAQHARDAAVGAIKSAASKTLGPLKQAALKALGPIIRKIPKPVRAKLKEWWDKAQSALHQGDQTPGTGGATDGSTGNIVDTPLDDAARARLKEMAIAAMKESRPVKVVKADRDLGGQAYGYITTEKYVLGKTPAELERILGFRQGAFDQGVKIHPLEEIPKPDQFELRGYSQQPQGLDPANIDPDSLADYPPGEGAPQWELTSPIPVGAGVEVGPGQRYQVGG